MGDRRIMKMDEQNISIKNNSRTGEVAKVIEGLSSAKPRIQTQYCQKRKSEN
jgi:hypothetical protein